MASTTRHGHLGQLIRDRRRSLGLRQEDLAAALDRYVKTVGNWERGATTPSDQDLYRLGEVLRASFRLDDETGEWATQPLDPPRIDGAVPVDGGGGGIILYFAPGRLDNVDPAALEEAVAGGRREVLRILREAQARTAE